MPVAAFTVSATSRGVVTFGVSHNPSYGAAWLAPLRKFEASYQSQLTPMLMRGATKYQRSASRKRIRLRWN